MLGEEYEDLEKGENGDNLYALGQTGGHNVVLACLPAGQTRIGSVAVAASDFRWPAMLNYCHQQQLTNKNTLP